MSNQQIVEITAGQWWIPQISKRLAKPRLVIWIGISSEPVQGIDLVDLPLVRWANEPLNRIYAARGTSPTIQKHMPVKTFKHWIRIHKAIVGPDPFTVVENWDR